MGISENFIFRLLLKEITENMTKTTTQIYVPEKRMEVVLCMYHKIIRIKNKFGEEIDVPDLDSTILISMITDASKNINKHGDERLSSTKLISVKAVQTAYEHLIKEY